MSKLEDLIKELCPDGVEYKTVGEICALSAGGDVPKNRYSKIATDDYKIPIYSNGVGDNALYGYTDKAKIKSDCVTVSARGTIGYSELRTQPFYPIVRLICAVPNEMMIPKFLKYAFETIRFQTPKTGIPQLTVPMISNIMIPVPPIEVQREIVRILDKFTELTAELIDCITTELSSRKKQYEFYRDELLNVECRIKNVECLPLCQVADLGTGNSNTDEGLSEGKYPFFVRSSEVLYKNEYEFDETAIITAGDGVGVGKVYHFVNGKYALHQRAYRIHVNNNKIIPKYLFYYFKARFLSYIQKTMYHGSVASIRRQMLNNFMIFIPPLDEQERIVSILDKFDKLCNDLSQGIPAEIELRKKQYEYYRDKLLSFKAKAV